MTVPTEFIIRIAETLEGLGIPYHVGGSVASSAHGTYRASAYVDFVIDPSPEQLESLERQWQDVLSVLAAGRDALDNRHLERWATELGVDDLLERARNEVADL